MWLVARLISSRRLDRCLSSLLAIGQRPPLVLRQEIDGPRAEQLEFVPCGQILQDEEEEELSPFQIRNHIFLILEVKENFPTIHAQEGYLEVKKGVMSTYP